MISYIYKWSCIDSPDLFYIGSTWNMENRKSKHKNKHKNSEYKCYVICSENGGYDNFIFEVLEEYHCNDKIERCIREQHWIDTLNPIMNSFRAYTSEEQKKEDGRTYQKEHNKEYYQEKKEEIKEKVKNYKLKNKEIIKERNKKYRLENKEKIKENYKLKNSEIIDCECGSKYKKYNNSRHIKTKIHKNYINSIAS